MGLNDNSLYNEIIGLCIVLLYPPENLGKFVKLF